MVGRLEVIDKIMLHQTYLVGERLTLADISLVTTLTNIFTALFDSSYRAKIPNLVRYTETSANSL